MLPSYLLSWLTWQLVVTGSTPFSPSALPLGLANAMSDGLLSSLSSSVKSAAVTELLSSAALSSKGSALHDVADPVKLDVDGPVDFMGLAQDSTGESDSTVAVDEFLSRARSLSEEQLVEEFDSLRELATHLVALTKLMRAACENKDSLPEQVLSAVRLGSVIFDPLRSSVRSVRSTTTALSSPSAQSLLMRTRRHLFVNRRWCPSFKHLVPRRK